MFVPTNRLILWTALIALPFGALAATVPDSIPVAVLAMGGLLVTAALDAGIGRSRIRSIKITLPELIRMQKDREGELDLRIETAPQRKIRLRIGLPLSPEFESESKDLKLTVPPATREALAIWKTTPHTRGQFRIDGCYYEITSPLGLWEVRSIAPATTEIRVYPNLLDERRNVSALFLARGHGGIRAVRQTGKGREFEKLRDYVHGDSYDDIHWKASAKRGHPVTKVYQVERTQEIYVLIDSSRLTARPSGGNDNVLERFVTAALILGMAAEQQGDLYGLVTFSDQVQTFLRARNGTAHYHACRDALYTVQPRIVSPDFEDLASFVRLRLRKRSLLVILTALDDPVLSESFAKSIELICRQHLVLVNMIQPPGTGPLFTDPDVENLDAVYQRLGGHMRWQKLRELEKILKRRGVSFALLENERMAASLVSQYLSVKARQLV